jgi:hypothetical protein
MTRRRATSLAACAAAALLALPAAAQQQGPGGPGGPAGEAIQERMQRMHERTGQQRDGQQPMPMRERMGMPAPGMPGPGMMQGEGMPGRTAQAPGRSPANPTQPQVRGRDGGALTEERIRDFFGELQREAQASVEQRDPRRIAGFVQRHLGDDAALWSATDVYVGGEKVHTGINTIGREQLSRMLGFASLGSGWTGAIRGYELRANVQGIEMLPGGAARVEVRYQEGGTFAPAEAATAQAGGAPQAAGGGGSPRETQARGTQPSGAQPPGAQPPGAQARRAPSGGADAQGAPDPVRYASTSDCAHLLSTGAGGEVRIGQTTCTGETRIGDG